MKEPNKHIENFLEYYIDLSSPEYAVLLKGEWGSGKTFFIDKFIESNKPDKFKFIKISLFGMRETSEIDEELFQQLHPILGNKYVKFIGNIAKGALKLGVNIDFNGDNSSDGRVTIDPKAFTMFNDDKEGKELIFIFDDLERTNIELTKVLGYINALVELSKQKVIILANDKKLLAGDENKKYEAFKEKVIGKTFEVEQDFDSALNSFLSLAKKSHKVLTINKNIISEVYYKAGYKNLRHIRQTILDFEHLFQNIDKKYTSHLQLMEDFIREFFIFSIEMREGMFKRGSISKEYEYFLFHLTDKDKHEDENKSFFSKYYFEFKNQQILDHSLWDDFFRYGTLDKGTLHSAFSKSKYFIDQTQEDWVRLWHFADLENDEFTKVFDTVIKKFKNSEYCDQPILLHVAALWLYFTKNDLYDQCIDEVKKEIRKVIDACSKTTKWKKEEYRSHYHNGTGLGYMEAESQDFQEIEKYLIQKNKEAIEKSLPEIGKEILEILQQPQEDKYKTLSQKFFSQDIVPPLTTLPVFSVINPKEFLDIFLTLKHKELFHILNIIKQRYNGSVYHEGIEKDLVFWEKFNKLLKNELDKNKGTIKGYWIKYTAKMIDEQIIGSLKKEDSQT